jgi:hypothetical protein
MAFDCLCIDFKNSKSLQNISTVKEEMPHVRVMPFLQSYFEIIRSQISYCRTSHLWVVSSLIDYNNFDFEFIPEQFQAQQVHVWSVEGQKEGDTFLIPRNFLQQQIKHLRDYENINYHVTNDIFYDYDVVESPYDLSNNIDSLKKVSGPECKYIKHFEIQNNKKIYPSYWEDLKIYIDGTTFYVPNVAVGRIQTQIYDYHLLYQIENNLQKDCFDIAFISNGEPFENTTYNLLKKHIEKNCLKNRLYWIQGVDGRTAAYKQAAKQSGQEYFYAVFAKSQVDENFMFDYTVDRAKNKRHYIFHAKLLEVGLEYGTFNINLFSKTLCLNTPDDTVLDFTLHSKHEVVPIVANTALLCPDNYTAWKNAFREVSKLILWNKASPTVEMGYRINKWLSTDNLWLKQGAQDAKKFVEDSNFKIEEIEKTYTWKFTKETFLKLYPNESIY